MGQIKIDRESLQNFNNELKEFIDNMSLNNSELVKTINFSENYLLDESAESLREARRLLKVISIEVNKITGAI